MADAKLSALSAINAATFKVGDYLYVVDADTGTTPDSYRATITQLTTLQTGTPLTPVFQDLRLPSFGNMSFGDTGIFITGDTGGEYLKMGVNTIEYVRLADPGQFRLGDYLNSNLAAFGSASPIHVVRSTGAGFSGWYATYSNDASVNNLAFGKSRGTPGGAATAVQSGDALGEFGGWCDDGVNGLDSLAASFAFECDAAPASHSVGGRIIFKTSVTSQFPTERARIDKDGSFFIKNSAGLFFETGDKIDFASADAVITHSTDKLAISGPAQLMLSLGTTAVAPLRLQAGLLTTTSDSGEFEYDGRVPYFSSAVGARQALNAEQISVLSADRTGTNVNTAQNIFGSSEDVFTLAGTTTYEFEQFLNLTRSTGTTSHTTRVLWALGTGSLTALDGLVQTSVATGTAISATFGSVVIRNTTGEVVTAANTSATEELHIWVRGIVRVNASGTFTPQFQYSATPGGSPQVKRGSFFRLWPIGDNNVVKVGNIA